MLGDHRIGLGHQILRLGVCAAGPAGRRTLELGPCGREPPASGLRAGTGPAQPRLGLVQTPRLDAEPRVAQRARHEQIVGFGIATTGAGILQEVQYLGPHRCRRGVEVVVTQAHGDQDPGLADQVPVLGHQIIDVSGDFDQRLQMRCGTVMITAGGGQSRFEKLDAPGVPADHVIDFGLGQTHLPGEIRTLPRADPEVDRQAIPDAGNAFHDTVVRGTHEVDLTELGEHLECVVVPVGLLDAGQQRHQQLPGRVFVGRKRQVTGALQIPDDGHLCTI